LPPHLAQFDIQFRSMLKDRFARGKFDVSISFSEAASPEIKLNSQVAGKIYSVFRQLKEELSIPGELEIGTIAGFHQMFMDTDMKVDFELVREVFERAVDGLEQMRRREGELLSSRLREYIQLVGAMNEKIREISRNLLPDITAKMKEKLASLVSDKQISEERLLQEASLIAMRLDIAEEITRIESHVSHFGEILGQGDIIGRKLDFIVQELNREVNTIGSKSADYNVSSLAVEMKAEIEKIKEQVQNIQ
jgi:uncharacterized protein (TIGR00255 family)